jgi:hypothetical protein
VAGNLKIVKQQNTLSKNDDLMMVQYSSLLATTTR